MQKRSWSIRRERDGVSPVIGTILLVGITAVLAATLWVFASGLRGNDQIPPVGGMTVRTTETGFQFTFTPFSKQTGWGDLKILITDSSDFAQWDNMTTAMLIGPGAPLTKAFGNKSLGNLSISCEGTDLAGDGYISNGDYFRLIATHGTFSHEFDYEVILLDRVSSSQICSVPFQG